VIGLDSGLTRYIDSLETRKRSTQPSVSFMPRDSCKAIIEGEKDSGSLQQHSKKIPPDRLQQISTKRMVSPTPRDLTEDKQVNQIVDGAKQCIEESVRAHNTWQRNRVNPLPQTKSQLNKARKIKHLQEVGKK